MFQPFKELRSLNLSYNKIGGFIDEEGFERLSGLKKVEVLDLRYNHLNNSILLSLSPFTSLKMLILQQNSIYESPFPIQELSKLKNLEYLDVSENYIKSPLPIQDFKNISKLSKLKYMDLSWNAFNTDLFSFSNIFSSVEILDLYGNSLRGPLLYRDIVRLKNLTMLNLGRSGLNGTQPIQSLCSLTRLQELDLSYNFFGDNLLPCFQNLTSLRFLDLSYNQFTGQIPSSWLASLQSLKYIDLSYNLFEGQFSFNVFANNSNIEVVKFASDNNKFEVVSKYPGWIPSFQLKVLVLQNCLDNMPEFLFHQFKLKLIDLSNNKINGSFPTWLLQNNAELDRLILKNNSFKGQIHLPTYSSFNTTMLDVSDNQFFGQLQDIGQIFPNMKFLDLSRNGFQGDFLFSTGTDCKLQILDLSSNNFSGHVPEKLISGCTSLQILRLSNNNFHGQIFTSRFNLTELAILQLNDNQFDGSLSSLVIKILFLRELDLSNNYFHGEIPRWVTNITYFYLMDLSQNYFEGQLSCEIFSVAYVDISHNSLSGALPSCFNVRHSWDSRGPQHMNLQGNRLNGSLPEAFLNSSNMLTLNLRENELSGSLPNKFGAFPNLRVLLLGGNRLNGHIPSGLCQLNNVSLLDLSRNYFSGSIPHCLYNLSFGRKELYGQFDVSYSLDYTGDEVYRESVIGLEKYSSSYYIFTSKVEEVEFVTKHMNYAFKGDILNYLFGLDLSDNNLEGQIPDQLGKLSQLRALNLSHNYLTGSIPASLSNLTQLESFDLSHNNLSGQIPSQLIALHFLAVFSVAYNNLSGKIPDMKGQFSTFDNTS
ncbi:hypothetical protein MANES_04G110000v8 [Manihot esculenta]|uniref:Leucine-rich repeat-containing N-terminal plant-type domain-containing protein n=1 Tax=Manihot esculenta TaxID=3983 RepID=A0A2C9W1I3_MANES|nr:hypothetical protein MANES_04G110000v8 [Manihot esculenta]